ncbi:diguanylate cyclase (GGDEF)-like protein [Saccharothrix coeruleofusca]|uniref:putative bifunctional diguanylate cyclase/phosphodiesterase n=1 Tax=Saccharothrix coeruleofusca TaxID=33919 RepID=UPI001AE85E6D|nr:EAL domain-containing protein [Saccharothrix coeruleofusca]MBP2336836.1 diguanylate cyclase (GGDEF)-like protein [Saccharothrix coeruleofusca]
MTTSVGDRGLRRIRTLVDVVAWVGGVGLATTLVLEADHPARFAVVALVAVVLGSWWLKPRGDSRWVAALEGVIAASALLLLPAPQVVIGFLFGVTTKRALRGERLVVEAAFALVGYLAGVIASLVLGTGAAPHDTLPTMLLPLAGLVLESAALHQVVRVARRAELAHLRAEDARATTAAVLHSSPVGLVLVDGDGTPGLHNERARDLLGWDGVAAPAVPCPHGPNIAACDRGCRDQPVEVRLPGVERVVALHPARVEQAMGPDRTLIAAVDISVRRRLEDQLRHRTERDELTGLVGRAHLLHLLDRALADGDAGLLVLDLDQFKEVNDTEGHHAGDRYLVAAAHRIRDAVEPGAVAARLGGDEFAVLVPGGTERECLRLAAAALAALREPWSDLGYDLVMRASIGVAVSAPGTATDELLHDADTAMYVAKREGGGRARLFRREMAEELLARQRDKRDLRAAIGTEQLVLHYQPIVDLTSSAVSGAEALVRWQRPGRGLLPPQEFIGLAEETGLIVPLGAQVLTAACAQAVRWRGEGRSLDVTVNVSTRQLSAPGFLPSLGRALEATALPPDGLTIEVTESVWADEAAMRALMAVRETGVRVALDDFGTGYSSLSYLHRYPFDVVKIDKSFTRALGDTGRTAGVVRCIIDLAEVLGAVTVAEGIETREQADWLRRAGCGYAQGFLFGRPEPAKGWDSLPSRN